MIRLRSVRLATGLTLFAYLLSHYTDHALGLVSYDTMEAALDLHILFWRSPVGIVLLYGAAITHFCLGLNALYQRRHFRRPTAELAQLTLGLCVPLLVMTHLARVRLTPVLFGHDVYYGLALYTDFQREPVQEWVQFALLLVAWTHGCIGLFFWLRLKRFFPVAAPFLLAAAVLLPALAMLGLIEGARAVVAMSADPRWLQSNVLANANAPEQKALLGAIQFGALIGYFAIIGLVLGARLLRSLRERGRGLVTLAYPDRRIRVPKGLSILEASLRNKIPHSSVCGGRARCTTCRVRVLGETDGLPPPSDEEAAALKRVGVAADPSIRLACQLRPTADIAFAPLLPPSTGVDGVRHRQASHAGEERFIVCLFVDMRGSTKLAESRLPFDTIFILNRFMGAVGRAVVDAGGQPNQFLGDGMLALFGLERGAREAAREALAAAVGIAANVERVNEQLAHDLAEPIRFGIGIHGGEVIVGDVGLAGRTVFTAIGDPVNVTARLQDMTKALGVQLVISEEVCRLAGLDHPLLRPTEVAIRGREDGMRIRAVTEVAVAREALSAASAKAPA